MTAHSSRSNNQHSPMLQTNTEVVAVLVSVVGEQPQVLTVHNKTLLPSGPLSAVNRSLQAGVRQWVEAQTQQPLGYIEQLYTFIDPNRLDDQGRPFLYVSYLGLVPEVQVIHTKAQSLDGVGWVNWYDYFPWECLDQTNSNKSAQQLRKQLYQKLQAWALRSPQQKQARQLRVDQCWGVGRDWLPEDVLLRYELLYEAGLVAEAHAEHAIKSAGIKKDENCPDTGRVMQHHHRRVIATAMARLRAKLVYKPLMLGLMPDVFTLLCLQKSVESILGVALHKQNFRRLLEQQNLLQATGQSLHAKRGRPAKLYRYRDNVDPNVMLSASRLPTQSI